MTLTQGEALPATESAPRIRTLYLAGGLATTALLLLGVVWPTLFTIFALFTLPAPIIFFVAVFNPQILARRRKLAIYLWTCVGLSILSWVAEIAWLIWPTW